MVPYFANKAVTIYAGDCLQVLASLEPDSIDAIVTDPPYGLGFMGKHWDSLPPGLPWAEECLRVLKPGGHLLAFGGTRTWHRLMVAIEDAGFEIRDSIAWLYGSGFPKSRDVGKAIDSEAGAVREVIGQLNRLDQSVKPAHTFTYAGPMGAQVDALDITAPATPEARKWQGWGTALKPAFEPIVVARKAIVGTVANNVLTHGTGAINIDGSRIGMSQSDREKIDNMGGFGAAGWARADGTLRDSYDAAGRSGPLPAIDAKSHTAGRWPANVILDETQATALDEQSGTRTSSQPSPNGRYGEAVDTGGNVILGKGLSSATPNQPPYGDTGGASRFFYCAKAPKSERPVVNGKSHPTVKPLALMRYLVKLVTPGGGTVLDTFAGSGATVEAAQMEGFKAMAIERDLEYVPMILARLVGKTATILVPVVTPPKVRKARPVSPDQIPLWEDTND